MSGTEPNAERLDGYAERWLAMRVLAPKTIELYRSELRCHDVVSNLPGVTVRRPS